jgi:predicted Zn-dependent peptidase
MLGTLRRMGSSSLRFARGQIPNSLRFDREIQLSTLQNGVRVASQYFEGPVATLGIMIEAGSRNETLHNSGVAHYLEHMHFKGTEKRSRHDLEIGVENIGGALNAFTSRDTTFFYIEVVKENCEEGLDIISDQLLHSVYPEPIIPEERLTILREAEEVAKDMRETLLEDLHYGVFRDHILNQPILGTTSSIKKINRTKLKKFIETHYLGPRIVVLGVGDIAHEQLMAIANTFVGKVPTTSKFQPDGEHPAVFVPSFVQTKDEKAENAYMAMFAPAPNWIDPDYWGFLLLQRLISDYSNVKKVRIDDPNLIYNSLHKKFDSLMGIKRHECLYVPYKDVGVFGHYIECTHEIMPDVCKTVYDSFLEYAEDIDEVQIDRGKNKIFNELLAIEHGSDILQTIGSQLIYMKRLVPRSEIAKRVAEYDVESLTKLLKKYFTRDKISVAIRGPMKVLDKSMEKLAKV